MKLNYGQAQHLYNSIQAAHNGEVNAFTEEQLELIMQMTRDAVTTSIPEELYAITENMLKKLHGITNVDWNEESRTLYFYGKDFSRISLTDDNPIVKTIIVTDISFRTGRHSPVWAEGKFVFQK